MEALIVTRHTGAVEWLRRKGITGKVVDSLDRHDLPQKQNVVGVLPLPLAVSLLENGCNVYLIQFPPRNGPKGADLSADEMDEAGAKLFRFGLKLFLCFERESSWMGAEAWFPGSVYGSIENGCWSGVRLAFEAEEN